MGIRIEDAEGHGATLEVVPGPAEPSQGPSGSGPVVGIRIEDPSGRTGWSCSPAAARELARRSSRRPGRPRRTARSRSPSRRANCFAGTSATVSG